MAGTLHARRPAVAFAAMSTALSTLAEYARANPRSQAAYERALKLFPSGLTHDARRQDPFPPCVTRAEGAYKWDLDGHRLLDYVSGHGAMVAGHSHPAGRRSRAPSGGARPALGAESELQADWAERIIELVPSAERVRFTSSGTEATLLALRVARGFTGRDRVLKLAGHFHGWHDDATPGVALPVDGEPPLGSPPNAHLTVVDPFAEGALGARAGAGRRGLRDPRADGCRLGRRPASARARGVDRRRGARQRLARRVRRGRDRLPLVAGRRAGADRGHARSERAREGRRRAACPAARWRGARTCMEVLAFREGPGKVEHPGTHNAHPLSAAAGIATLDLLADGAALARANAGRGELRAALCAAFERAPRPATRTARRRRSASSSASAPMIR